MEGEDEKERGPRRINITENTGVRTKRFHRSNCCELGDSGQKWVTGFSKLWHFTISTGFNKI